MTIRYTRDHEYISVDGDIGAVGITDYAQSRLGDVVHVDLPEIGRALRKGQEAAVVESVKAASDIFAPVAGEVVAVNPRLEAAPGTVNEDAPGRGWFFRIRIADPEELAELMNSDEYANYVIAVS